MEATHRDIRQKVIDLNQTNKQLFVVFLIVFGYQWSTNGTEESGFDRKQNLLVGYLHC